jgi:hypothetical protein
MHRRLDRLETAFAPALLRQIATAAAEAAGLDPEDVFREAEAILTRCAGLSLPEIAAQEGIDLAELEAVLTSAKEQTPP